MIWSHKTGKNLLKIYTQTKTNDEAKRDNCFSVCVCGDFWAREMFGKKWAEKKGFFFACLFVVSFIFLLSSLSDYCKSEDFLFGLSTNAKEEKKKKDL